MHHGHFNRFGRVSVLPLILTCCAAGTHTSRSIELGAEATLAPNESVAVAGTALQVQFVSIVADSRCPRDATCVWAGEVMGKFAIRDQANTAMHEVRAGDALNVSTRRLVFVSVEPERLTQTKIPAGSYRVTIRIE
jgi:hypothetical protein